MQIKVNDISYFDTDNCYFYLTSDAQNTIYREKEIICSYSGSNEWYHNFVCQMLDLYSGNSEYNYALGTYKHEDRFKELSKTDAGRAKAQNFVEYTTKQPVFMKMYANVQKIFDDLENWDNYDD